MFRSACSASTMSFSRSLIKRPNASSCCVRNSKERVLPELKAFRARCTTSLILLMIPRERRKGPWSFYPVCSGPGAQEQTLTSLRCVNLIERGRSPWELWKCTFILLPQVSNPDILTYLSVPPEQMTDKSAGRAKKWSPVIRRRITAWRLFCLFSLLSFVWEHIWRCSGFTPSALRNFFLAGSEDYMWCQD